MANQIDTRELISALNEIAKEKNIDKEALFNAIKKALETAYKSNYGKNSIARVDIDRSSGEIAVLAQKKVVDEVMDPSSEVTLEEARDINPRYCVGDLVEIEVTPRNFGRIAAQTAKNVVMQSIREAQRSGVYDEYSQKENEILTAIVQRVENNRVYVELGRTDGVLEAKEQIPGEVLQPNERIKVYVLEVSREARGPQISVSRTNPGLVKRLFELEVPEIVSGVVQIKSIAREAGYRTKMAVISTKPEIDPVGSCVGPKGMRVENVVQELKTEKIDIIKWSNDPAEFIANALNPARVISVEANMNDKSALVVVPDNQLSLAIGKEGQNARLAAKLTGWKIDIKCQSEMSQIEMGDDIEEDVMEDAVDNIDLADDAVDDIDVGDIDEEYKI